MTEMGEFGEPAAHGGEVEALAFSPDGARLYSASGLHDRSTGGELRVWSIPDGRELRLTSCARPCETLDVSPDGGALLVSTGEGRVEVWATGLE